MKVLITGEKGYIANKLFKFLKENDLEPRLTSFRHGAAAIEIKGEEALVHCAAIVHKKERDYAADYEKVNYLETVELAKKAKAEGVKHFIFISTMSVYGLITGEIKKDTPCKPITLYGASKLNAEYAIRKLEDKDFRVTIIRPPMIYGKDCPGNFARLVWLVKKSITFARVNNKRSMLYIDNLTELIYRLIVGKKQAGGIILPMDDIYVNTSDMADKIAGAIGKELRFSAFWGVMVNIIPIKVFKKVFGSLYYSSNIAEFCDYVSQKEAVKRSVK